VGVKYSNNASTTLPGGISDSATSITVTSAATFPAISSPDYAYLTLVSSTALEVVKCTDITGNVLTVVREQEDTDASAFVTDDRVELRVTTAMLTDALAETVAAAATSASAAATSATAAATSYDNFDDRWLGSKSSDPSVDNDGATLLDGAAYFNTSNNILMVYDLGGTTWNGTTPSSSEQTAINAVNAIASDIAAVAADATDIGAVAAKATEIGRLGTAAAVTDMSILGTAAIVTDMSILGTAAVVEDMSILGTADIVTDMSILATSDIVTDMSILATPAIVTDMSILGTADVVEDMSILGTADVVTDMSILATSDIVTDMSILGTTAVVEDMSILGTSAVVTDMSILATSDIVTDMSILGTADVVEDMSILGTTAAVEDLSILGTAAVVEDLSILATPAIVEDMSILGTSGNVTAMASCATNEASINRYSDEYTVASSVPGSPNEGDLWFDSSSGGATSKILLVNNGSSFVAVTSSSPGILSVAADSSPQLGGDLDLQTFTLSNVSLANGGFYSNPNTITGSATVTTAALKNMFLMGQISVNDTYTWSIAGDGVLQII
jgi:carbonic anhydrase/acetyltransferase-like protein (isoleucine patch superfamily)